MKIAGLTNAGLSSLGATLFRWTCRKGGASGVFGTLWPVSDAATAFSWRSSTNCTWGIALARLQP